MGKLASKNWKTKFFGKLKYLRWQIQNMHCDINANFVLAKFWQVLQFSRPWKLILMILRVLRIPCLLNHISVTQPPCEFRLSQTFNKMFFSLKPSKIFENMSWECYGCNKILVSFKPSKMFWYCFDWNKIDVSLKPSKTFDKIFWWCDQKKIFVSL